jgi:hypothetical protein
VSFLPVSEKILLIRPGDSFMSAIFCLRLGFVVVCLYALYVIAARHEDVLRGLRNFFFAETAPENLALLRIAVFSSFVIATLESHAPWFATLPIDFRDLPRGWPWLEEDVLPIAMRHMDALYVLLLVTSVMSILGAGTRVVQPLATLLAVFVLGVPNFFFKISHGMHVQVLCAAVLSASPSGDALSVDALLRRYKKQPPFARATSYTVAIRFCWLLLGTMYLFPGLWKLWESGDLWIDGTKLRIVCLEKWGETYDVAPRLRVDRFPGLAVLFGASTLLLEIGFFPALFNRFSRVLFALAAASFHIGVGLAMDIWFDFWWPLIVLLDFPDVLKLGHFASGILRTGEGRRWPLGNAAREGATRTRDPGARSFVVGAVMLLAMFVAGLAPVDSWPVAVYPRFQSRPASVPTDGYLFEYWAKTKSGDLKPLTPDFYPIDDSAGMFRLMWKSLDMKRAGDTTGFQRRITFLARLVRFNNRASVPSAEKVIVYLTSFPLEPDERKLTEKTRELVAEVDL